MTSLPVSFLYTPENVSSWRKRNEERLGLVHIGVTELCCHLLASVAFFCQTISILKNSRWIDWNVQPENKPYLFVALKLELDPGFI